MINLLEINVGSKYGGVEKHVESIIKYIDNDEFNIFVVCRYNSYFYKKIIQNTNGKNIKIIPVELKLINLFKILKNLKDFIKFNNIEVIHSHGIASSFIGKMISMKTNILITTVHGYSNYDRIGKSALERFLFDKCETILCKRCDLCIAVSNDIKKYLLSKGINKNKIKVIHHGIEYKNTSRVKTVGINDKFNIISLGRLDKVKDYKTLIKAINECTNKGYKINCEIAGNGEEKEELTNLISELGLEDNCRLVGFVEDTNKFLLEGDIYVQSSLIESFGISIIEAMQVGLPVIASNIGGIRDIISNNIDGILFEVGDYKELSNKVIELIEDYIMRESISYNGQKKVNEIFLINKKIKELQIVIKKLVGDKNENSNSTFI